MARGLPNDQRVSRHWSPTVDAIPKSKQTTPPLTVEIVAAAGELVRAGNFRYVARQSLGLPLNIWRSWLARGARELDAYCSGKAKAVTLYALFVVELDHAEAEIHESIVGDIMKPETPISAKLWYLERRYNKLYTRNPGAHIDDETAEEIEVDVADMLTERLKAISGVDGGGDSSGDR